MGIPMLKTRQNRLIFNIAIPIPVRQHLIFILRQPGFRTAMQEIRLNQAIAKEHASFEYYSTGE